MDAADTVMARAVREAAIRRVKFGGRRYASLERRRSADGIETTVVGTSDLRFGRRLNGSRTATPRGLEIRNIARYYGEPVFQRRDRDHEIPCDLAARPASFRVGQFVVSAVAQNIQSNLGIRIGMCEVEVAVR
jgi:hypothetical protein